MLICFQKINFITHFFLKILPRNCFPWDTAKALQAKLLQACSFGYFGHVWPGTPKVIPSIYRKLSCLFAGKKSASSPHFFWRHCEDMQTYFGHFGHAWQCTPKSDSINLEKTSIFICMLKIFLFEILHFTEYGNLVGQQHLSPWLENQNFARYGIAGNINNNVSLHFRLFLGKTNNKSFWKNPKSVILGPLWALFCLNCGNNDVPRKKGSVSFKRFQLSTIAQNVR